MKQRTKDCHELYEYIGGLSCMLDTMAEQYPRFNDRLENIQACLAHAQEDINYFGDMK